MAFGGPGGSGPPFDPLRHTGRVGIPGYIEEDEPGEGFEVHPETGEVVINDLLTTVQSSYINDENFRMALSWLVINDQHALASRQLEVSNPVKLREYLIEPV